jgi:hypothetical protein
VKGLKRDTRSRLSARRNDWPGDAPVPECSAKEEKSRKIRTAGKRTTLGGEVVVKAQLKSPRDTQVEQTENNDERMAIAGRSRAGPAVRCRRRRCGRWERRQGGEEGWR